MSLNERVCPVCGKPFAGQKEDGSTDNAFACTVCGHCNAMYHDDCWKELKRCVVSGCRCTRQEMLMASASLPDRIACPSCKEENPYIASLCSKCETPLEDRFVGEIFTSYAGWQARTDKELCLKADKHWESATRHLYNGDFEYWLRFKGCGELADKAREIRLNNKQRSIGVEKFLEASGYVDKPVLQLSKQSLIVECASDEMDTVIDLSNGGRGYLYGTLKADVDWIIAQPQEFAGNKQRIMLTIDMTALSEDSQTGHITFDTVGGQKTVEVTANRIAISAAVTCFREGNFLKARSLGRKLLDSHILEADAAVLCAACCLKEENYIGAVSDLRRLSGHCKNIPGDLASLVYRWLKENPPQASNLEKDSIYAALVGVADDSIKDDLHKDMARIRLDKLAITVDSGSGSGTLWQSEADSVHDIKAALKETAELDPSLAEEARDIGKRLKSSRSGLGLSGRIAIACLFLVALLGVFYYIQEVKKIDINGLLSGTNHAVDLVNDDFSYDVDELYIGFQNAEYDDIARTKYDAALIGLAEKASDTHSYSTADKFVRRAVKAVGESKYAKETVASRMYNWAVKLQKQDLNGEAYIRSRQGADLNPNDLRLQELSEQLSGGSERYYELFNYVDKLFATGPADSHDWKGGMGIKFLDTLKKMGVEVYKARLCCVYADFDGDGQRDLLLAGCNDPLASESLFDEMTLSAVPVSGKGRQKAQAEARKTLDKASKLTSQFAVYRWRGRVMDKCFSKNLTGTPHLVGIDCARMIGGGHDDALIVWNSMQDPDKLRSFLLGNLGGKFVVMVCKDTTHIDLDDENGDGLYELWISRVVANSSEPAQAVLLPYPYTWNGRELREAQGDFHEFYIQLRKSLDSQIQGNPYPPNSRFYDAYKADREKAKEILQERIKNVSVSSKPKPGQ